MIFMKELIDKLHGLASFNFYSRKNRESIYFYIPNCNSIEFSNLLISLNLGFRFKHNNGEDVFIVKL